MNVVSLKLRKAYKMRKVPAKKKKNETKQNKNKNRKKSENDGTTDKRHNWINDNESRTDM